MTIIDVDINTLKPYNKNAKNHDKDQITNVTKSIQKYGFIQPIVIDKNNCIVIGHCRAMAAKQLKMDTVPCVCVTDLTTAQTKELRILDNKLNESDWDFSLLDAELAEIDLSEFGWDFECTTEFTAAEMSESTSDIDYKQTQKSCIENFFRMDWERKDEWGIPHLKPFNKSIDDITWISFNELKTTKLERSKIGVHFYIDDYQFERVWNNPTEYVELLQQCKAVITPDFSNYTDMPKVMHLWSHFKRQWCGVFWQQNGINVIPSISYGLGQMYDFSFVGIPKNSILATSFGYDDIDKKQAINELDGICKELAPTKLIIKSAGHNKAELQAKFNCEFIKGRIYGKGKE